MNACHELKAIIWDLDGTIIDSHKQHFTSMQKVFQNHGLSYEKLNSKPNYGKTSLEVFQTLLGRDYDRGKILEMIEEKEKIYRSLIVNEAEFLPGVESCLKLFKGMGLKQAIASSTSLDNIKAVISALDANPYFAHLVSGEGLPSKPSPLLFLLTASKLGEAPSSCLVIEDSPFGVKGAKAAGMKCLAVPSFYRPNDLGDADLILHSLEELNIRYICALFS